MTASTGHKRDRVARRAKVAVILGAIFVLALLVAPTVIPWIFGIVVDAQHVYLDEVPEENRGAYLVTEQGAMQLYNWHLPLAELPADAPALNAGDLQAVSIVMKQLEPSEAYDLFELETGALMNWQRSWREGRQLLLDPGSLPAGDYMLVIPTDDMFGEKTYHYFRLR